MRTLFGTVVFSALLLSSQLCAAERLTPERLWDLGRVGDASVSVDGSRVAYLVTRYDLAENKGTSSLFVQSLPGQVTGTDTKTCAAFETPLSVVDAKTLLSDADGLGSLAWLNHSSGEKLIYVAPGETPVEKDEGEGGTNEKDGDEAGDDDDQKPQAWWIDPATGDTKQLTFLPDGIGNLKPSPMGNAIAFTMDVKLDSEATEIHEDLPKADARIIDSLMYRHWNAWHDYAYSHVHVVSVDADGVASEPVDLMNSLRADCPLPPFGGAEHFAFSPDGNELALTIKMVNNPAESTDSNIFLVPITGGPLKNVTPGNPGYDTDPVYSPDGKFLAFHSMQRAGFESDRNRIMLLNRASGEIREITEGLDQTTHHATWSPDSRSVFFYSETRGTNQIFQIRIDESGARQVSSGRFNFAIVESLPNDSSPDSSRVLVRQQSMLRPTELAIVDTTSQQMVTITDVNGDVYEDLELPSIEERFFTATDGKKIHNWVILPPDYDAKSDRQWPMLTYCQGGPQGQIGQWFSYRWNFHLMASKGYVVLAVNRRGLPGFGREWNDQISGDWGGQAMQDILASTDGMVADPTIDPKRVAAIGASFGGYTVYWLMGNHQSRFCAMAAHCGVFNLESMYGSTEELFFVNWDLGGPYWTSESVAQKYKQFSPHRFAGNWKTPLLVIHGQKDYRVPVTQGMEAFTAAQVQGVPSRFLYFPNEGHWVMSPQNGVLWGRVFFDWLDRYCDPVGQ